jgi:hypothetical protein
VNQNGGPVRREYQRGIEELAAVLTERQGGAILKHLVVDTTDEIVD